MAEEDPSLLTAANPLHERSSNARCGHPAATACNPASVAPGHVRPAALVAQRAHGCHTVFAFIRLCVCSVELLSTNNFRGGPSPPAAAAAALLRATAPQDCEVMISFNMRTAGEEAIALTKYLEAHDIKTFCTALWCPQGGAGANWREDTIKGVKTCKVYVPLMTDGWQDSNECQFETQRALNRLAAKQVVFVPVQYESFSVEADGNGSMFLDMIGTSTQFIFKDTDVDWMGAVLRGARSCFQGRCAFAS